MSTPDATLIGRRFKEEVENLLSATEVAQILGVHRNTVTNWYKTAQFTAIQLAILKQHGLHTDYILWGAVPGGLGRMKEFLHSARASKVIFDGTMRAPPGAGMTLALIQRIERRDGGYLLLGLNEDHVAEDVFYTEQQFKQAFSGVQFESEKVPIIDSNAYAWIPFYDAEVSAGHGRQVLDEPPKAWNAYRKSYLNKRGLNVSQLAEFTVVGDSMENELKHGDTVLVDQGQTSIRDGSIYVLALGEDLVVKYLQRQPGDVVQVSSENRNAYPPYTFKLEDVGSGVVIIGRVVRQGRDR